MQELIDYCDQKGLDQHPYLQQMQSEPADLGKIYDIMSNAQAFAASFAPWL
jgi:hypothetical protein